MIFLSSFFYRHSCNVIFNVSLMVSKSNNCLIVGVHWSFLPWKEAKNNNWNCNYHENLFHLSFLVQVSFDRKSFCGKLSYFVSCNKRKSSKITFKTNFFRSFLTKLSKVFFSIKKSWQSFFWLRKKLPRMSLSKQKPSLSFKSDAIDVCFILKASCNLFSSNDYYMSEDV